MFKSIFGEAKQMGTILAKTFEGKQIWVRSEDGTKIDCMFFSGTSEKIDNYDPELHYKNISTFILCNPNAMFY
jgi:hypothetical protein